MELVEESLPGHTLWSEDTARWDIPFCSVAITLNILVTSGITYRLLSMRMLLRKALPMHKATMYTSITAMVIESAAIQTVTTTVYLVCYIINSPFQPVILPIATQAVVRSLSSCNAVSLLMISTCIIVHCTRIDHSSGRSGSSVVSSNRCLYGEHHQP